MIHILKSGKFWLKLLFFGTLAIILLAAGSHVALQSLFSETRIQTLAARMLAGTGRQLHFDRNISRNWLPRPTVTLHHVRLSNPNSDAADADIGRMQIGLGWQSLLGRPVVEKWVWQNVRLRLYPLDGRWNVSDLLQRWQRQPANHVAINRLLLRDLNIDMTDHNGNQHRIRQADALISRLGQADSPFEASGVWQRQNWPEIRWRAQGQAVHTQPRQWQNVRLSLTADLPYLGASESQWQFNGTWQPSSNSLLTGQVQWQWRSNRYNLSMNGSGQRWQVGLNLLKLPQASVVINTGAQPGKGNATLLLNRLQWQNRTANLEHFQFNGSWQQNDRQTLVSMAGGGQWLSDGSWRLSDLAFNSHQDTTSGPPNPRWVSEINGNAQGLGLSAAHTNLNGTFDKQNLNISADYAAGTPAVLSGKLSLGQLSLRPYWPQNPPATLPDKLHQQWRRWLDGWQTDWAVRIGRITTPLGQLDQVGARLRLDATQLQLDDIHARLYGGESRGRWRLRNLAEAEWQLEQRFDRIQIKPLLQDTADFHNLDGRGNAYFSLSGQGWFGPGWLQRLNGQVQLQVQPGSWRGIDINNILQRPNQQAATLAFNEQSQTPFQRFEVAIPIRNGIGQSQQTLLNAANFHINGAGTLDFVQQQMDYDVLVHTRQNNGRAALLPLKISGSLTRPSFSLDFARLTQGLQTPEQKETALRQTLKQQWQWLNQGHRAAPTP